MGCLDDAALPSDRNMYRGAEFGSSLFPSTNLTGIYVDGGCQLDCSLRNKTWKVYDLIMVLASVYGHRGNFHVETHEALSVIRLRRLAYRR